VKNVFKRILVAVDHSTAASWALNVARSMADEMEAEVLLVHVTNKLAAEPNGGAITRAKLALNLKRKGRALLRRTHASFGPGVKVSEILREGCPADEILASAGDWDAQLIIIGAFSSRRLAHLMLGSTADTVARKAKCPVVTVGDEGISPNSRRQGTLTSSDGNMGNLTAGSQEPV
jgi:nucleotide-binding universal stress UspA family protein